LGEEVGKRKSRLENKRICFSVSTYKSDVFILSVKKPKRYEALILVIVILQPLFQQGIVIE
jgi:hypothetical protein